MAARRKQVEVSDSSIAIKPREYVARFRSVVRERVEGTTLLPSIVMAHAMYEASDDKGLPGNSPHAKVHHNDVRLFADKTWKGRRVKLPVRESLGLKGRKRKRWFRIYASSAEAIGDRVIMLLTGVSHWPKRFWYEDTVKAQAALLTQSLELTDARYAERLVRIVMKHKLHWMDRQWMIEKVCRMIWRMIWVSAFGYALHNWWDAVVPWRW